MQDVQTLMRRELLPWRTLTRWMLGSQRRLERRCEWLTCLPTHGPLPQISHRYDTTEEPPRERREDNTTTR